MTTSRNVSKQQHKFINICVFKCHCSIFFRGEIKAEKTAFHSFNKTSQKLVERILAITTNNTAELSYVLGIVLCFTRIRSLNPHDRSLMSTCDDVQETVI